MIMATNRPDTLDPALLRPGRLDRKIGSFAPICTVFTLLHKNGANVFRTQLILGAAFSFGPSAEISLPNEQSRLEILKIHAQPIAKSGDIDYESVVKLTDGFNGADLRNVCTEAGLFAIRDEREFVIEEDMMKAARKVPPTHTHLLALPAKRGGRAACATPAVASEARLWHWPEALCSLCVCSALRTKSDTLFCALFACCVAGGGQET